MAENDESKKADYEKLDQGPAGDDDDGENAKKEPFIQQDPDLESKPPKEKPHPGSKRSTYKSIGLALAIVLVVVVIIAVVAVLLITNDKSGSKEKMMESTTMAAGSMTSKAMDAMTGTSMAAETPVTNAMSPTPEPDIPSTAAVPTTEPVP